MDVRRVVTGETAEGWSFVADDAKVEGVTVALLPGAVFHRIWGSDEPVRLPTDGAVPHAPAHFPSLGGFRFGLFTMGPDGPAAPDLELVSAQAEVRQKLPGLLDVQEPGTDGRHTTATIDFILVLSGEVWLLLDEGAEVPLGVGDCVVQNGTRHAWSNRTSEPCVMAVAQVGAVPRPG